jgi:hypothetical protein
LPVEGDFNLPVAKVILLALLCTFQGMGFQSFLDDGESSGRFDGGGMGKFLVDHPTRGQRPNDR